MINVSKLFEEGQDAKNANHKAGDAAKLGNLRGGSAGAVCADGKVYGKCGRLHLLRTKGISADPERFTDAMFAAGLTNEDSVAELLNLAPIEGHTILREEECPVMWNIPTTDKIATGRPDIVYRDNESGKYVLGLELKNISSIHTARNVIADFKPDSGHMVQAAFYSYRLGAQQGETPLPYRLVYTNSMYWHIPFSPKYLAEAFQDKLGVCEHKGDRPFKVLPGRFAYDLTWEPTDGTLVSGEQNMVLSYGMEECLPEHRVKTIITLESIEKYFIAVAKEELTPRPSAKHAAGGTSYTQCQYCSIKEVCHANENNKELWVDSTTIEINNLNEEKN